MLQRTQRLRFTKRHWLAALLVLPLMVVLAFVIWATWIPAPMAEAVAALASTPQVTVAEQPWLVFRPTAGRVQTGLIFYPGARVNPRAYAPAAQALAAEGFLVALVPMPLNFAVFAPARATDVIAAFPDVGQWVIGGHSLGGSMAAQFAFDHPDAVAGLVLWASYPPDSANLSAADLEVASIYGTEDGLLTPGALDASRALLPPTTRWVALEGGNHAQFGWYGPQSGDNPATLSHLEQGAQTVAATLEVLQAVEAPEQE